MVSQWVVLASALGPAILLVAYVYARDKYKREPISQILKGLLYGVLSALLVLMYHDVMGFVGLTPVLHGGVLGAIEEAVLEAAIPEETAKLLMLWLLVRRNRYFDEYVDGVVYAVCVGMGFAGLENILYVVQSGPDWAATAAVRAVFAVPGHYMDAVAMGFFYANAHFRRKHKAGARVCVWLVPVLWHGIYDALCMTSDIIPNPYIQGGISLVFIVFFVWAQRRANRYIDRQLERDRNRSWHKRPEELIF